MDAAELFSMIIANANRSYIIAGEAFRDFPDVAVAYQKYADAIGKPIKKLTDAEKQQAIMNAVLNNKTQEKGGDKK